MKKQTKWMLAALLLSMSLGAQAQSQSKLERDLADLRAWMRQKAGQADSVTRAEWPAVKQEFQSLTTDLDRNTGELSEKSKQEYDQIKSRYSEWEARNETRKAEGLDSRELERWKRALTGTANIGRIKPANLRDTFVQALEYTRGQRRNWSLRDWDYAGHVFGELNTRKAGVLDRLSNGDKIKIAALQVEFATLRKSRDAKDAYESMREQR